MLTDPWLFRQPSQAQEDSCNSHYPTCWHRQIRESSRHLKSTAPSRGGGPLGGARAAARTER